jgi:diaminopimelate epimerase
MIFDLTFYKMHSCLNDFVIIDARGGNVNRKDIQKIAPRLASRDSDTGGCDQVLIMETSDKADCTMIIYNADGSEAGMCGNGLRCVGWLLSEENDRDVNSIEIQGEVYKTTRKGKKTIAVNIGEPKFFWHQIPLAMEMETPILDYAFEDFKSPIVLNVGNPHAIFFMSRERSHIHHRGVCCSRHTTESREDDVGAVDLNSIDLQRIGKLIEHDALFPERINVSFVKIRDERSVWARTWERGAGETKSCGSGASAIAWASIFSGAINKTKLDVYFSEDRIISVELLRNGSLESSAEAHLIYQKDLLEV